MKRYLPILTVVLAIACIVGASFWTHSLQEQTSVLQTTQSAAADVVNYASNRITGGIGIQFNMDPATGAATVVGVFKDSPAQLAGILEGDIIAKINGQSVTGISSAQVTHRLTGLGFSSVKITLSRKGGTNMECVIQRKSWSRILGKNLAP